MSAKLRKLPACVGPANTGGREFSTIDMKLMPVFSETARRYELGLDVDDCDVGVYVSHVQQAVPTPVKRTAPVKVPDRGIRVGDIILAVDSDSLVGLTAAEVRRKLEKRIITYGVYLRVSRLTAGPPLGLMSGRPSSPSPPAAAPTGVEGALASLQRLASIVSSSTAGAAPSSSLDERLLLRRDERPASPPPPSPRGHSRRPPSAPSIEPAPPAPAALHRSLLPSRSREVRAHDDGGSGAARKTTSPHAGVASAAVAVSVVAATAGTAALPSKASGVTTAPAVAAVGCASAPASRSASSLLSSLSSVLSSYSSVSAGASDAASTLSARPPRPPPPATAVNSSGAGTGAGAAVAGGGAARTGPVAIGGGAVGGGAIGGGAIGGGGAVGGGAAVAGGAAARTGPVAIGGGAVGGGAIGGGGAVGGGAAVAGGAAARTGPVAIGGGAIGGGAVGAAASGAAVGAAATVGRYPAGGDHTAHPAARAGATASSPPLAGGTAGTGPAIGMSAPRPPQPPNAPAGLPRPPRAGTAPRPPALPVGIVSSGIGSSGNGSSGIGGSGVSSSGTGITRPSRSSVTVAPRVPLLAPLEPLSISALDEDSQLVLHATSDIDGRSFPPFDARTAPVLESAGSDGDSDDFCDPDGLMPLGQHQRPFFTDWIRLKSLKSVDSGGTPPVFVDGSGVSEYKVQQSAVANCTVVTAIAMCASHERRFGSPLLSSIVYPRDASGRATYNPRGKYCVRLYINGCWRTVIIDDRLPHGRFVVGHLLCAASKVPNELWVSLLEKAYLKLFAGYDVSGSFAASDMMVFSSWPSQSIEMPKPTDAAATEALWQLLVDGLRGGSMLASVSVDIGVKVAGTGLIANHGYGLVDAREVLGLRLVQLKNPWGNRCWTGEFGPSDTTSWTPELCHALSYDPVAAAACDGDGVFWMRFSTMLQYFGHTPSSFSSAMSVCWRPLRHHSTVHRACTPSDADGGRDYSQVRHLPQFRVEVTVPSGGSGTASPPPPVTVMLHLERHIASARHDSSVTAEESAATRDTVPAGVVRLRTASINRGTPASTSPSGGGAAAGAGTAIVGGRSSHTSSEIVGLAVYGADAHTASVTGDERVYERRGVLHEDRRKGGRSAMLRFTVPGTPGTYAFIAVVAVESTQPSYSFTLGAFCDEPVHLRSVRDAAAELTAKARGRFRADRVGGNNSSAHYFDNPQYHVDVDDATTLSLCVSTTSKLSVFLSLFANHGQPVFRQMDTVAATRAYSFGVARLVSKVPAGRYTLLVSTFDSGVDGDFHLVVSGSSTLPRLTECSAAGVGLPHTASIRSTLARTARDARYDHALLSLAVDADVIVRVQCPGGKAAIGVELRSVSSTSADGRACATDALCYHSTATPRTRLGAGTYTVRVAFMTAATTQQAVVLTVYASSAVTLQECSTV